MSAPSDKVLVFALLLVLLTITGACALLHEHDGLIFFEGCTTTALGALFALVRNPKDDQPKP